MAGVPGLEPGPKVLETSMLTIDTIPLRNFGFRILDFGFEELAVDQSEIRNPKSQIELFIFLVQRVAPAAATELFELQPVRRVLFVLGRHVIALFALRALQNYVISRHTSSN